jgi:ribonuclease HI
MTATAGDPKASPKPSVEIYADGACSGNPGAGGFAAIIRHGDKEKVLRGCDEHTTNNRMELLAVIAAIEALKMPCKVTVTTDSNYVVKGMTEWVALWTRQHWKNSQKKPVLNVDLWKRLLKAAAPHDIDWAWVRGHRGHPENERCDRIAREALKECREAALPSTTARTTK